MLPLLKYPGQPVFNGAAAQNVIKEKELALS
jgi:hypothetical protein